MDISLNTRNLTINCRTGLLLEEGRSTPGNITNDLDVSSEFDFSDNLSPNTQVNVTEGIRDLPVGASAAEDSVRQACSAVVNSSSLSLAGRGNIPRKPTDILSSNYIATSEFSQRSKNQSHHNDNTSMAIELIVTAMSRIYPARDAMNCRSQPRDENRIINEFTLF